MGRYQYTKIALGRDEFQFDVTYAIGAIKADAFSTDTKVFTLMWLEIKLIYCGLFT